MIARKKYFKIDIHMSQKVNLIVLDEVKIRI